jgi:hypothetical protein
MNGNKHGWLKKYHAHEIYFNMDVIEKMDECN